MVVQYKYISIIPDNDAAYFSLLKGVIDSLDPGSQMCITKASSAYHFRLIPSNTLYIDSLIQEILVLSNLVGLHLDMSKSIKSTSVISFSLNI